MYVCMCRAVSHTTVLVVIEEGARTVEEISEQCRAASACGRCRDNLAQLLEAALTDRHQEPHAW
jgi:bacterioferritin-associated ferredoxin